MSGAVLGSPIVPQRDPAGDVGVEAAVPVDDGVVDGLQSGEPVPAGGDVGPGFGGLVIDAGEQPHPAVPGRVGYGRVGAPHQIRSVGDNCPVIWARRSPAGRALRVQQPLSSHQAQDPLARHLDAVLTAHQGSDLAVALPGER